MNSKSSDKSSAKSIVDVISNRGASHKQSSSMFRLMMHVVGGDYINDHYWLSGYKLGGEQIERNPRRAIRVRLNTIEERVADRQMQSGSKSMSAQEIYNSVKSEYETGSKRRKLLQEHIRDAVFMISAERVVYLETKDNVDYYRAHWTTCMSSNPYSQFIQGLGHIRIIQEDLRYGRPSVCQVEIIENILIDATNKDDNQNNKFIASALNSHDATTQAPSAERNGKLMVELMVNGERENRVIDIYNERKETKVKDYSGKEITVRKSASYADTIQAYLTAQDYHTTLYKQQPQNNSRKDKAFEADISRQILGYLLGIDVSNIPIVRTDLADEVITPFIQKIYNKEIRLNLFSVRIYQYGSNYRKRVLAQEAAFGLNKNYVAALDDEGNLIPFQQAQGKQAIATYTPTAIAIQRHEDGTAYIVFSGPVNIAPSNFFVSNLVTPEMVNGCKDFFQRTAI